ncbi:hypothetical protein VTN02DRAFT_6548 [Thermoascus thermophilus]
MTMTMQEEAGPEEGTPAGAGRACQRSAGSGTARDGPPRGEPEATGSLEDRSVALFLCFSSSSSSSSSSSPVVSATLSAISPSPCGWSAGGVEAEPGAHGPHRAFAPRDASRRVRYPYRPVPNTTTISSFVDSLRDLSSPRHAAKSGVCSSVQLWWSIVADSFAAQQSFPGNQPNVLFHRDDCPTGRLRCSAGASK